jgi:predicted Zn-dependent protease
LLSARVHAAEGQWEEAEAAAWKAIERGLGGRDSHDLIVRSYLARKGSDPRVQMERLLAARPDDVSALVVAGGVHMQRKEFSLAAAAYEKCLSIRPDAILALNNLAYLYAEQLGNADRALELARKARELDPNSPEVADTLGWILFNRRDYAGALELLAESAARLPSNPEVQFHFARASQMMGQVEPARAAFAKAAAAAGEFEGKAKIKDYLVELDQSASKRSPEEQ